MRVCQERCLVPAATLSKKHHSKVFTINLTSYIIYEMYVCIQNTVIHYTSQYDNNQQSNLFFNLLVYQMQWWLNRRVYGHCVVGREFESL